MLFYWSLVVTLQIVRIFGDEEHQRVIRQDGPGTCTTEDDTVGTCIDTRSCPSLLNLLNTACSNVFTTQRQIIKISYVSDPIIDSAIPSIRAPPPAGFIQALNQRNRVAAATTEPSPTTPSLRVDSTTSEINDTQPPAIVQPLNLKNRVVTSTTEPNSKTNDLQCGKSNKMVSRRQEGYEVLPGDWPFTVALGYRTEENPGPLFHCVGGLLSNQWVVTAAHCVSNMGGLVLTTVRVGDLNLNDTIKDNATPIDVPFDEIIMHPEFSTQPTMINDIALIRLKNPVTFTELISPICIMSEAEHKGDRFYQKKLPFIIRWGPITNWEGQKTYTLQDDTVSIVDNGLCAADYAHHSTAKIDQRVICANDYNFQACDTGGIMVMAIAKTFYLAGVESYLIGCGNMTLNSHHHPRVFTKVAHFVDWIKRTAQL